MVKINQSLEISDDIKFDDETDILKRKQFGESLSNLILNSENESLVISVNADWGEGKTDFLKRWKNYLEEKELNTIYFNSFKNDYIEDPFLALLGEITKAFDDDSIKKEIFKKGKNILKGILPLAGKITARWLMKGDNEQIDNDLEKLIEGDIAKEVGKKMEEYFKKEDELIDFKNLLEGIIEKKGKQLVFIIDELDRCRPDFALRLLERIKHFFDIKGLYFVLGINKKQIERYIEKIYGNIDSRTYLEKFIDIETILPKKLGFDNDYLIFLEKKLLLEDLRKKELIIKLLLSYFSTLDKKISLRLIEKIINYIILFEKSGFNYHPVILVSLILLKINNYKLFLDIKEGKNIKSDLLNVIKYKDGLKESFLSWIDEALELMFSDDNSLSKQYIYHLEFFSI